MKFLMFIACCLVLSACGQDTEETRTTSKSPSAAREPLVIAAGTPQKAPTATPDSGGNVLHGSMFKSEYFDPSQLSSDGSQLLSHYGSTSATVELKSTATRMIAQFKPLPKGDSYPVVQISALRTTNGPYRGEKLLNNEIVRSGEPIVRDASLEAGTWLITVGNFSSSGEERANLEIHSIKFE